LAHSDSGRNISIGDPPLTTSEPEPEMPFIISELHFKESRNQEGCEVYQIKFCPRAIRKHL
jgi:hypothetical protein